ncbi:MAG: CBS domain-containing protein [Bdellovibrio bacteriovorus]
MKFVADILRKKGSAVWTIKPDATVREALTEMSRRNVGALVVAEQGRVVGVISERDFARKAIIQDPCSLDSLVADLMVRDPHCVGPANTIAECMSQMTDKRIRHLPVLDEEGNLSGIVSIGDVVAGILSECESKVDELKSLVYGA